MVFSTEYSEAVNMRYMFQLLWVSGFTQQRRIQHFLKVGAEQEY